MSQTRVGSVVWASSCSSASTPRLETSIGHRQGPKRQKEKKRKKEELVFSSFEPALGTISGQKREPKKKEKGEGEKRGSRRGRRKEGWKGRGQERGRPEAPLGVPPTLSGEEGGSCTKLCSVSSSTSTQASQLLLPPLLPFPWLIFPPGSFSPTFYSLTYSPPPQPQLSPSPGSIPSLG